MASADAKKKKNACETCRRSKVRCHLDTFDECGKCRRCFDSDKQCIFITPPPRKPRKRTDARVTTLEKQLATMQNMFEQLQEERANSHRVASKSVSPTSSNSQSPELTWTLASADATPFTPQSTSVEVIPFLLSSSMLSEEEARELFKEFVTQCLPQFPIVTLNESFDSLRQNKPMLLLAAIAAASNAKDGELFIRLHRHLIRMVSDRVVVNGERNIELLESIMLLEVWFCPPDDLRKLNFYQWIHMAATMAMQLGIVGETASSDTGSSPPLSQPNLDEDSLRLGLAVYFSCSSAAISLKRRKILQLTPTLSGRLDRLRNTGNSLSDRRLSAWIDLQLIAEKATEVTSDHAFSNDAAASIDTHFEDWKARLEPDVMNVSLLAHYHFLSAKLHELSMKLGSGPDELAPPYLPTDNQPHSANENSGLINSQVKTLREFVQGCHSILDAFVTASPVELRHAPTVTFVRAVYGIKGLMLVQLALTRVEQVGQVLSASKIRYQAYLEALQQQLGATAGNFACKVPSKVLELVTFLAERNALDLQHAAILGSKAGDHGRTAMNGSAELNQVPTRGIPVEDGPSVMYDGGYFTSDTTYGGQYGSDIDMLQMPDLGDFSFLANQDFGFDAANLQDLWGSSEACAMPNWPT